jgi:acetyl-CoA carboxylase biotin carboxyl carrier protein
MADKTYDAVKHVRVEDVSVEISDLEHLAYFLDKYDLTHVEVEENGMRVVLERQPVPTIAPPAAATAIATTSAPGTPAMVTNAQQLAGRELSFTVTAPLLGMVYRASSPQATPFVAVGQQVHEGDVLCLIEAMKSFNEVPAPKDGVIQEIHFEDGTLAEYGAPLFTIG